MLVTRKQLKLLGGKRIDKVSVRFQRSSVHIIYMFVYKICSPTYNSPQKLDNYLLSRAPLYCSDGVLVCATIVTYDSHCHTAVILSAQQKTCSMFYWHTPSLRSLVVHEQLAQ